MTNSVNDAAAKEVTAIENKMISALTREQFEKIASDEDAWEIMFDTVMDEIDFGNGVIKYCNIDIRNERLGIDIEDMQYASDEDGDVDDVHTSNHKFDEVKFFGVKFPISFDDDDDCDEDRFLDLIGDVVTAKIDEAASDHAASYDDDDDDDGESEWIASLVSRKPVYSGPSNIVGYEFLIRVESGDRAYGVERTMMKTGETWGDGRIVKIYGSEDYHYITVPNVLADALNKVAEVFREDNLEDEDGDSDDED